MKHEEQRPSPLIPGDSRASMPDAARAVRPAGVADPAVDRSAKSTTLGPSLLADLERFGNPGAGIEPLEVMAACIRHAQPLLMFLDRSGQELPVRLFPKQGVFFCTADLLGLPEAEVRELRFLRVEPELPNWVPQPLGNQPAADRAGALLALMWQLAL